MIAGGCSTELLQQIADATMEMTLYYYRVQRVSSELARIPLRQVGRTWTPDDQSVPESSSQFEASLSPDVGAVDETIIFPPLRLFLPTLQTAVDVRLPPDDPTGCPCGWFTADGRMVDVTPRQVTTIEE
jgi:hypothetical protein